MPETPQATRKKQRAQLAAWLDAYYLDRDLRDETMPPSSAPQTPEPNHASPEAGQIRLLPPTKNTTAPNERPIYVLVVSAPETQNFTVIPFSRFDSPATPHEWQTNWSERPLQVLCFWNARTLTPTALKTTWLVQQRSEQQRQEVVKAEQTKPVCSLSHDNTRFGPPLAHPLDPRHVYLQEEKSLLDDAMETITAALDTGKGITYEVQATNIHLLRAAESPPEPEQEE